MVIYLPNPDFRGGISLYKALLLRRSVRRYTNEPITMEELSQLLWGAQGLREAYTGFRTAPSAGATYPLNLYAVVGERGVMKSDRSFLDPGVYGYDLETHSLALVRKGDVRRELYAACLNQEWVLKAPVSIVITAVYGRTTHYYGGRGKMYVHMEVGHVGQNIYLVATSLNLGTVAVGAFHNDQVSRVLRLKRDEEPLYVMPIGRPAETLEVRGEEEILEHFERARKRVA